ncbi:Rv1733c family protein [Streptomyces macrosporus]|uniref:Proline rich protein membrane protein n=1 Tax=Streptomyces macrosporus TaxID=44032 RepID=A0ABN3JHT3_9ACTN
MTDGTPRAQPPPAPRPPRWWRWRRNPLRRPIDLHRVRTALALTVTVLAAAPTAALLVGDAVHRSLERTAHEQARSLHRGTAVLLHDVPRHLEPGSEEARHVRYPATVRFTDRTGRTRTAGTEVPPGLPAGTTVQVWSDDEGRLADPPLTAGQVRDRATAWAVATGAGVVLTGAVAYAAIDRVLKRRALDRWEKAWADTAPRWTTSA